MSLKYTCLLPALLLLSAPQAKAWELLGLAVGTERAVVVSSLLPRFPAESALKSTQTGGPARFVNVQPLDAQECIRENACRAGYNEQLQGSQQPLRGEQVQLEFSRSGQLMVINYQQQQKPATECRIAAARLIHSLERQYGEPKMVIPMNRGGVALQQLQWGACNSGGECLMISVGCGQGGLLETSSNLHSYALRNR